jgi:integrase
VGETIGENYSVKRQVYIEKLPSGNYSVRHWADGKFIRELFFDFGLAKRRAADLTLKLEAFQQGLPDPTVKPIDIYNRYIESIQHTHRAKTIELKYWHARPFFEQSQHVTEKRIREYKAEQLKTMSVSTVSIRLREIRAVCNWAKKEGLLQTNVFENVEIPAAKEGGKKLDLEVIKKIWNAADPEFRPFLGLLIYTGARYSEILLTKWTDIDLDKAVWHIPAENCKTNKERFVPLDPLLVSVFNAAPKPNKLLFPDWVQNTARWYLRKACKKAGLSDVEVTPHTFRHTFASHWGGDIRDLMDMCGWTTMMMPKRYTHNSTEDLRKEANEKGISANLRL